jgi:hypothetical protein
MQKKTNAMDAQIFFAFLVNLNIELNVYNVHQVMMLIMANVSNVIQNVLIVWE